MPTNPCSKSNTSEDSSFQFVVSDSGSELKRQLKLPSYYAKVFTSSDVSLLVLCLTSEGDIVGACSLSGMFHMAVLYIDEGYRRKGLGSRLFLETIRLARERGMSFLTGAVPPGHIPALRMDFKVGFKVIRHFKDFVLIMRPLNLRGRFTYFFFRSTFSLFPEFLLARLYDTGVDIIKKIASK